MAMLDTDKLHELLPGVVSRQTVPEVEYSQWSDAVSAKVRKHAPEHGHSRLEVCLLDRNLETLLAVIGHGARELDEALGKSRLERDKILQRAAGDPGSLEKSCAEVPSWEHLVATVARLVGDAGG
ncbi:MAG TPA: hypothetical protein VHW23_15205 [Kofleriaceae bacterium]|nr:hypothetical protein [Kofleriaceae bacterium]